MSVDTTLLDIDKYCLKKLEICLWEREPIFDKIFFELSISFLIFRTIFLAELIEGKVFNFFLE